MLQSKPGEDNTYIVAVLSVLNCTSYELASQQVYIILIHHGDIHNILTLGMNSIDCEWFEWLSCEAVYYVHLVLPTFGRMTIKYIVSLDTNENVCIYVSFWRVRVRAGLLCVIVWQEEWFVVCSYILLKYPFDWLWQ